MALVRFSGRAEADLLNIVRYHSTPGAKFRPTDTLTTLRRVVKCSPTTLQRVSDDVRLGLRRHVVFYRQEAEGILVSRILHQRMLPKRQAIDDDDDGP